MVAAFDTDMRYNLQNILNLENVPEYTYELG
jgi:hypothetical protein